MKGKAIDESRRSIKKIIRNINKAWTEGHVDDLNDYFHEDMVIARPGGKVLGRGKQACVNSYREFLSRAAVRKFEESDPEIEIWGNTAVASYTFETVYTFEGSDCRDKGVDLFVLSLEDGQWLVVWRAVLPG